MILNYVSVALMILGFISIFSANIGIIRSKYFYNKLHFLSLADGLGVLCFSIGILLTDFNNTLFFKILFFLIIYLLGSTTTGYILGNLNFKVKNE